VRKNLQDGGVEIFPAGGTSGQIQFNDPEGNRVVVSENGWTA
jgi:hypothetical protein